ncbi:MAG: cysteate racemase [Caulobacteraceae bacterium]
MTEARTLGVLGGMGPAATLDFLTKLQRATPAASDQDHIHVLVDLNPQVPDRNAALAGSGPSPAPLLAKMARGLEAAGAEGLVMVCNSAHAFAADIRAALVAAPLISLIDETVVEVQRTAPKARRVGLLAASACLDARLYQDAFERVGIATIAPEGELRRRFMALLYGIKAGDIGPAARSEMAAIGQALAEAGAEVIVSGCTEVPLVLQARDLSLPLVDSTDVLVAAALAFARPTAG